MWTKWFKKRKEDRDPTHESKWTEEYLKPGAFKDLKDKITEKTIDGEVSFEYYVYVPDVALPAKYSKGWFPKALQFAQQKFDLTYCNKVINRLESTVWDTEKAGFTILPNGGRRDPPAFHIGLTDIFDIVPTLHSTKQYDALERVFAVAKTMFMSCPRLFLINFVFIEDGLSPAGALARFDNLNQYLCPVKLFLLCYSTRVLQTRFPFNCIPVQEFILKRAESKLQEKTLREFAEEEVEEEVRNLRGEYLFEMMRQAK